MKARSKWTAPIAHGAIILCVGLGLMLTSGIAHAQLSVSVTASGTQTTSPGTTVAAGSFSVSNNSTTTGATITAIQISISNPNLFSSMSLTGTAPNGSTQTVSVPLQSSSTVTFTGLPVALGQAATFNLNATTAGSATPTPVSDTDSIEMASVWPHYNGASRAFLVVLALLAVGMLWQSGRLKRRHLVTLVVVILLAAKEVGCGDCNLFGCGSGSNTTGSSDQQVTGVGATPSFSLTGVPADLGTITSQ